MKKQWFAAALSLLLLGVMTVSATASALPLEQMNALCQNIKPATGEKEPTPEEIHAITARAKKLQSQYFTAQMPMRDDEAVQLDVTQLEDVTDEITEIHTIACVRAVEQEVYLPGYQRPKTCIKLYLPGAEEMGCVFVDELMVFKNGTRCNSELDCGDLVYFEKKFNGTISKVHILWDMDDKGKKNGNDYSYTNVGYWTDTTKQSGERDWGWRGTLDEDGKRYTNELRILYTPNVVVNAKTVNIGGYAVPKETRVIEYTRYTKDKERFRCSVLGDIDLTNPERKEIFNSIVNTPENMKRVKTFYLHWHENKLTDIVIVQDVKFE